MNDELIERLAELLEHAGPLPTQDDEMDNVVVSKDSCVAELVGVHAVVRRIRVLLGSPDPDCNITAAALRKALS